MQTGGDETVPFLIPAVALCPAGAVSPAAGGVLPRLGAGHLCAAVLLARAADPGGCAGCTVRPAQTETGPTSEAAGEWGVLRAEVGGLLCAPCSPTPLYHPTLRPVLVAANTLMHSDPAQGAARSPQCPQCSPCEGQCSVWLLGVLHGTDGVATGGTQQVHRQTGRVPGPSRPHPL